MVEFWDYRYQNIDESKESTEKFLSHAESLTNISKFVGETSLDELC